MGEVGRQLSILRRNLLDLTLHNRLLNFRHSSRRSLKVIDEIPSEIYDLLVLNERTMYFRATEDAEEAVFEAGERTRIWEMPDEENIEERHQDRYLQTNLAKEALQKTLFIIDKESRTVLGEQGYTVLYLALGFLKWIDDDSPDVVRRAPLVMIPVDLERQSVGSQFKLRWSGEDILGNISLQARLRESNVELPGFEMPEDKAGVDGYLQQVKDAVAGKSEWSICSDIVLGFFSFTKFVMHKDLAEGSWPADFRPAENPIVHRLFEGGQDDEESTDEPVDSVDQYHVVDADPSQIRVIEGVKAGRSLLVEGPPGTGKSQTILNIIAELLAQKKTVLFVSEKMAALQVVKSRLDHVGLGDYCLELHSRKSNKKEVLRQLESTLRMEAPRAPVISDAFGKLDKSQGDLDAYVEALHEPFAELKMSPYALLGQLETAQKHFDKLDRKMPLVNFIRPDQFTPDQFQEACSALEQVETLFDLVRPIKPHPWYACNPVEMFDDDIETLDRDLATTREKLKTLKSETEQVRDFLSSGCKLDLKAIRQLIFALELISAHEPVSLDLLKETAWNQENPVAEKLTKQLESFRRQRAKCERVFKPHALDKDVKELTRRHDAYAGKFFRFLSPTYRQLRGELADIYEKPLPGDSRIKADLALLQVGRDCRDELEKQGREVGPLFGPYWRGEESDTLMLTRFMGWIIELRQLHVDKTLSDRSLEMVATGCPENEIHSQRERLVAALTEFDELFRDVLLRVRPDEEEAFEGLVNQVPLDELDQKLESWQASLDRLPRWYQYTQRVARMKSTVASSMLEVLADEEIEGSDLLPTFRGRLFAHLMKSSVKRRLVLKDFVGEVHDEQIDRFRVLDEKIIKLNRYRLARKLYHDLPRLGSASANSQAGVLNSEFNRKRGHMPIRKLLLNCGEMIQRAKPCFMMSPLSVAQFLQPGELSFDVVIFDEASQVRPEEAIGAFMRSRQLVVMGDSHQLPPTSFFDRLSSGDASDEELDAASAGDMESLLNLCRGRLQEQPLQWHYRSRHESLIAVSNQESYDNRLLVFPSPFDKHDFLGLQMVHLPENKYDRGKSRMNRGEASAVVDAIIEHLQLRPDRSLGVGTFSVSQQQAILEEVELRLRESPELEPLFHREEEPFFVKNLETIQGDERDVIFISIGYGFDEEDKLSLNFGPLNQAGGERRLNVLITRAREQCRVFSNFQAQDLPFDADSNVSQGMKYLRAFLDYAQSRSLATEEHDGEKLPAFERSVFDFLESKGYKLRPRVGCAQYRLDMAVVDPEDPHRYLLGIETDGSTYKNSNMARDRDRLRGQVLRSMDWRLHRVWSIDWFRSHKQTQERLLQVVEQAAAGKDNGKPHAVEEVDFIQDANGSKEMDSFRPDAVVPYEECSDLGLSGTDLGNAMELAKATVKIVEAEAPIHHEAVAVRISKELGVKKGRQALESINQGIDEAVESGKVTRKGEFLWPQATIVVRARRRKNGSIDVNWISNEEVQAAVRSVLARQFATPLDELAKECCYAFGFKRATEDTCKQVETIILQMETDGALSRRYGDRLSLCGGAPAF